MPKFLWYMNYDSDVSKEDGFTRKEVQWHILLLECNIIEFHQTYITFYCMIQMTALKLFFKGLIINNFITRAHTHTSQIDIRSLTFYWQVRLDFLLPQPLRLCDLKWYCLDNMFLTNFLTFNFKSWCYTFFV
jgi:hypothetical protein